MSDIDISREACDTASNVVWSEPLSVADARGIQNLIIALRAALDAAESDKRQAVLDWQPIETAPKDGTRVLVVEDDGQQFVAAWEDGVDMIFGKPTKWACPGWVYATHGDAVGADCPHFAFPTHWMPLPEPPGKDE